MKSILAALVLTLAAGPALALSCQRPDLVRSFKEAERAAELYSVVLGQITFDPLTPPFDGTAALETAIPARLEGRALTPDGFTRPLSRDITLLVRCVADTWCGSAAEPGTPMLAFLRHDGDDLVLDLGPCPQWLFTDPRASQIELVSECFTGGPCPETIGG